MKLLTLNIVRLVSVTLATAAIAASDPVAPTVPANAGESGKSPKIQFDSLVHDFGKVASGDPIQHTFIVSNAGDATLVISGVRPSCGCTTAGTWSKEIEPAKTGVIPIQINSSVLHGSVEKQVTVTSNDKLQPTVVLRMRGNVWKPIEFSPQFAALHLDANSNATTVVMITNKTEAPVTLSEPVSANKYFTGTIKTIEAGRSFELTVTAVPPLPTGNVMGSISIKTSSSNASTVTIPVTAIAPKPALFVMPPSISLGAPVLDRATSRTIAIQASLPTSLTLSDATTNAKGVTVQVTETQPGRRYNVIVSFPQGYQLPSGESVEVSLKSNYPQFPLIHIPVTLQQLPGSAAVAARKG